jgi:hypothetical protein
MPSGRSPIIIDGQKPNDAFAARSQFISGRISGGKGQITISRKKNLAKARWLNGKIPGTFPMRYSVK